MSAQERNLPTALQETARKIASAVYNQGKLEGFLLETAIGDLGRILGITETKKINIPHGILTVALERTIPAKESYFKTNEGLVVYEDGQPILGRENPQRIEKERQKVLNYINNLSNDKRELMANVLGDPNSDTKLDIHKVGVERINVRRFKPMSLECRAAVIIPARFEEKNIREVLDGYLKQEQVSPKQFEINVIVNHRIDESPDQTSEVVLAFMRSHPELTINLIDVQFDKKHANVSWARKLITDIVLNRAVKRDGYWSSLYIITEDADVSRVDPKMVKTVIEGFDKDPVVDCLRGRQDRSNALIAQNFLCALKYKSSQIAETILRDKRLRNPYRDGFNFDWNRVVSGGWACAFTAEAYALIGGYLEGTVVGEDVATGQLCSIARGHRDSVGNMVPFLDITKTIPVKEESNFLRLGKELVTGVSAYDKEEFENQDIKKKSELELLEALKPFRRINPEDKDNVRRFQEVVCGAFYFLRGGVGNDEQFLTHYAPLYLFALGFKKGDYEIVRTDQNVDLKIKNWSTLMSHLDQNRQKHLSQFEEKYI